MADDNNEFEASNFNNIGTSSDGLSRQPLCSTMLVQPSQFFYLNPQGHGAEITYLPSAGTVDSERSQRQLLPRLQEKLRAAAAYHSPIVASPILPGRRGVPSSPYTARMAPFVVGHLGIAQTSRQTPVPVQSLTPLSTALNSRPPLRLDMDTPGPTSYDLSTFKPLRENTAPSFTIGKRCWAEKNGGASKSWSKSWFSSANTWVHKVDFKRENAWPTPSSYGQPHFLLKQPSMNQAPNTVIGRQKREVVSSTSNKPTGPGPSSYNLSRSLRQTHPKSSSFTHQFRNRGTILWQEPEPTPAPSEYSPRLSSYRPNQPRVVIRNLSTPRGVDYGLGPFASAAH